MRRTRSTASFPVVLIAAVGILAVAILQDHPADGAQVTPTPYHEGQPSPVASPHTMSPTVFPLPAPEDLVTADTMAAGGVAMIETATGMSQAAQTMITSGVPELVDLGQHWAQDAAALQERGTWMVLSATANSMVHDPDKARELNLQSLRGNGLSMAAEGQAMVDHGNEMVADVAQLRRDGVLSETMADELTTDATALVDAGKTLVRDGERMQEYAEKLLRSIGQ